jgi:hypothetical protein
MGILKDKANQLKNDPWYKKLRRWIKFTPPSFYLEVKSIYEPQSVHKYS